MPNFFAIAWIEYKAEHKHTFLSHWWNTVNFGLFMFGLSLVFGQIFNLSNDNHMTYLTCNFMLWNFFNDTINELTDFIRRKRGLLLNQNQSPIQLFNIGFIKNIYKMLSYLPILIIVITLENSLDVGSVLELLFYLLIYFLFIYFVSLFTSFFVTIIPEIKLAVNLCLRVLFFMTPIFWYTNSRSELIQKLLQINPFYHLLEGIRSNLIKIEAIGDYNIYLPLVILIITSISSYFLYSYFNKKLIKYV